MTSWLARDVYSPLCIIAAGLLAYAGVLGVGRFMLRRAGLLLPSPWNVVTGVLLGLQVMSLGVQLLGMTSLASRWALIAWLLVFGAVGVFELAGVVRARATTGRPLDFPAALSILAFALVVNLVIAAAPSTKADEVYYHMLVPSRLVHDHALILYQLPWEAAWIPQLAYQIASAPLHAARLPDAPNVLSWALSATLAWFCYRLLRNAGHSRSWSSLWCTIAVAGMFGAVWYVTGGAHAMGELAIVALAIAVLMPESLRGVSDTTRIVTLGILASAAAMTKLSTVPIAVFLLVAGTVELSRGKNWRDVLHIGARAVAPVIVLWGPAVVWTWYRSGVPFGPFFSWWFPHSIYGTVPMRDILATSAKASRHAFTPLEATTRHSPLLALGVLGALFSSSLAASRRGLAAAILAAQSVFILAQLSWDPRFLSGLPIALAMLFALSPPPWALAWYGVSARRVALWALIVPWVLAPVYYARPFANVVFGLRSATQFREENVAFFADYRMLDSILPTDAVLAVAIRTSSAYMPRLPVYSLGDVRSDAPVYQFAAVCESLSPFAIAAETVYFNRSALARPVRTPGQAPGRSPLCVRRLVPPHAQAQLRLR